MSVPGASHSATNSSPSIDTERKLVFSATDPLRCRSILDAKSCFRPLNPHCLATLNTNSSLVYRPLWVSTRHGQTMTVGCLCPCDSSQRAEFSSPWSTIISPDPPLFNMADSSPIDNAIFRAIRASLRLVHSSPELLTMSQLDVLKSDLKGMLAVIDRQIQVELAGTSVKNVPNAYIATHSCFNR